MKFLVDHQLPSALARYLQKRGFDCQHLLDVGLAEASDAEICNYVRAQERIVVSKDQDFLHLANGPYPEIKVLWVRLGNCRTSVLLATFDQVWSMIESCFEAGDRIVEIR